MPTNDNERPCTIYEAKPADAAELARLRWEYRVQDQTRQAHHEFLRECEIWLKEALTSGQWTIAVAESEGQTLCGCMYLQCVSKVPIPGAIARAWGYVTNAYVCPEQRGHGTGRDLLNLLIDVARTRELEFLIVWPSEEAVTLYERAGFRPAAEVHDRSDDYPPLELEL